MESGVFLDIIPHDICLFWVCKYACVFLVFSLFLSDGLPHICVHPGACECLL